MEVLRRFKLPDAKSVIPKFGSSNSHQSTPAKERELSAQSATTEDNEHLTIKKERGGLGGTDVHASTTDAENGPLLLPKKARGKQPIAPKPDENSNLLTQRSKPPKPSSPVSPKSPRPRPSHGRAPKRPPGRGTINNRVGGATPPAQDPPGNVHRKESIVAAHLRPNGSPGGGSSSSSSAGPSPGSPMATPNSQHGKRNATKKGATASKGASADVAQHESSNDSTPTEPGYASVPPPLRSPALPQSRPIGRGPLGMERRPTPAPYVLQSPSGVDAKKATIAVSSLLDAGGGVIGELDGAGADDDAVDEDEQQKMLMNLETPRIRNVATVVATSISGGESLPVYPEDPASAAPADDGVETGDDEASLPDEPHVLATDKHSTTAAGSSNQLMNPNDSTASLGRQSTTSAALRRRGRSHSRTRRTEQSLPTSVSVSDGTSTAACPNSPTRSVLRSRSSQRRQRRSRSTSRSNRTRTHSTEPTSAGRDGSASPGGTSGSVSPSDAARLSPAGGRRPQRAPPVTKRTHAQKMSMKNAIKAADLDMLATPSVTAPSSSTSTVVISPTSITRPNNGAQVSSPVLAAASMAEAARWRAPAGHDGDGPTREHRPATKPVLTPPASVMSTPIAHEDDNHKVESDASPSEGPAAGGGMGNATTVTTTKSSNPVRSLAKGLLKRRPSLVSRSGDPRVPSLNSGKS